MDEQVWIAYLEKFTNGDFEMILYLYFLAESITSNGYTNKNLPKASNGITPPPGIPTIQTDKPPMIFPPPTTNQSRSTTIPPMDQMKNLSVSSTPVPPIPSSRPVSTVSYLNEYEIIDTSTQPIKKPVTNVASFPPRQNASLFTTTNEKPSSTLSNTSKSDVINEQYSSSLNEIIKNDHPRFLSKSNNKFNQSRDVPTPTPSNNGGIRFGNTSGAPTTSSM
jgi:hypothetical protein